MKIKGIRYTVLAITALLAFMSACTEDTESQDALEQEQRFFDIYMGTNYPEAEAQPSGLYYVEHSEGTGDKPDTDEWVLINHVSYTIPDNVVYETYIESVAIDIRQHDAGAMYGPYKMPNGFLNEGLTEGLNMMREGGKATLLFTSDLGYGSKNSGSVGAYRSLKYEIELLEVIGADIDAYEKGKIESYLDTIAQVDTVYDAASDELIHYIVDVATEGPLVGLDSTLAVAYKGYLTDGRVFDEKTADDPFIFKTNGVEWGARWDLVLPRLHEGEKVRMIIPYQLAYGENGERTTAGNVKIPPFETLIFDVEILSVEAAIEEDEPGSDL
jgi:FKBP-type peptidyl-prolyl cis-trans isomerase FkpA